MVGTEAATQEEDIDARQENLTRMTVYVKYFSLIATVLQNIPSVVRRTRHRLKF